MNTIEKRYLLSELTELQQQYKLPDFLAAAQQSGRIENVETLAQETLRVLDADVYQYEHNLDYYCSLYDFAISLHFFLKNDAGLEQCRSFFDKKMNSLNLSATTEAQFEKWKKYFDFFAPALNRIQRRVTIESFEDQLDEMDWAEIDGQFLHKFSILIAYAFGNEDHEEYRNRAKHWYEKALTKSSPAIKTVINAFALNAQLETGANLAALTKKVAAFQESVQGLDNAAQYSEILLELSARLQRLQLKQPEFAADRDELFQQLQDSLFGQLKALEGKDALMEAYWVRFLIRTLIDSTAGEPDEPRMVEQLKKALKIIDALVAGNKLDPASKNRLNVIKAETLAYIDRRKEAADLYKEVATAYKKSGDVVFYSRYLLNSISVGLSVDKPAKAYEQALEVLKYSVKKLDTGGFEAALNCMRFLNPLFHNEIDKPGVSWMVNVLDVFFANLIQLHNVFEQNVQHIGAQLFQEYKKEYIAFRPVADFNIRVYFQYQFHEIKLLELSALIQQDETTLTIARNLLDELQKNNNPLTFMQGNWADFTYIPHSVRNKVLNKCINISKGDLPLAAEHLNFSYRNLRSYITYRQVHRLGFFLDEQSTSMRKLEAGIRLMLHDLYERGKIFEVVFDMPRFLIQYSAKGFYAEDMQTTLNIKYNTAKKYLKIMTEIGVIEQDRSQGRKNFFLLSRDKIMNRYIEEKERETHREEERARVEAAHPEL